MIHSNSFTVVLDACVLYPAPIRDLLLSLAAIGFYRVQWSDKIQSEWSENLLANRPDLQKSNIKKTIKAMDMAFPDARIEGYEDLIAALKLPDPNDRHVLACAIRCKADLIVTLNTKDFPRPKTQTYDVDVQHPDNFVNSLIDLDSEKACTAFTQMIARLNNPPMTTKDVVAILKRVGLKKSAGRLLKLC